MIIKPTSTEPGPPVVKALAVETKRPAPMAPPLGWSQRVPFHPFVHPYIHGDHLHVSPLQVAMQLAWLFIMGIDSTGLEGGRTERGGLLALLRQTFFSAHRGRCSKLCRRVASRCVV